MFSSKKISVFLDRDGVINANRHDYVKSWAEFQFLPGALEALKRLADSDVNIIVITNQSAIGRGILSHEDLETMHTQMTQTIENYGGRVDAIFYCPHHPDDGCHCRKPKPGLLERAAAKLNLNLAQAYFVGDAISDLQTGLAAGCSPLLVLTGRGQAAYQALLDRPLASVEIFQDLSAAVNWILPRIKTL